jgi:hypothetical protein
MDLNKVKNANDWMMEMYKDNNPDSPEANAGAASVDNAGAVTTPVVETELIPVSDGSSDSSGVNSVQTPQEAAITTDDLIDDWDITDSPATEAPKFDFKELGKALEIDGVESKDSLVTKVKSIIDKNKELDKKLADYSSIPEQLREAIEVANRGGDYLEFLGISTLDYDALDDRTLVEEELINLGLFKRVDGSIDEEALDEYVGSLDERELRVRGAQVRNRFKYEQENQRQTLKKKADDKRNQAISDLRGALDKLDSVGPFKLNPNHKKEVFDLFVSGQMMKELFYDKEGRFDYAKAAKIVFKEKYSEKIEKLIKDAIKSQTKKEVATDLKNVDLGTPNRTAMASVPAALDPMEQYMRKLQGLK